MDGKTLSIDLEAQPFTREGFLKFRQLFKALVVAVVVLSILFVVCAGMLIWAGTLATENHDDIDKLKMGGTGGVVSGDSDAGTTKEFKLTSSIPEKADTSSISPVFQGTGYWSLRGNLPFKRSDHHVAAVGDLVYIVGGNDEAGEATDDITIFDPLLNSFSKGPKMPVTLTRFVQVYVPDGDAGKLYLIGGMEVADADASGKVHILDIKTKKWSKGPEIITPRSDFCGAYVDGKIYIAGGWPTGFSETLGSVEVLDLEKGSEWEEGVELPTPRGDCKAAALDGRFVVVGGYYDEENQWRSDSFRDEVEAFNPESEEWEALAPLPNARGDKALISLPGDRLLAIGGETHSRGERTQVATHFVEEYIGEHDVWIEKAPLLFSRFRTAAAHVDGVVFLFGGHAICVDGEEEGSVDCPETDEVQAFFDVDHPDVFLVDGN
ncbi:hypothetical protein BSKO_10524 [Bryopsis sp. KO-2023]|nr:hypothetical protein BSKO_10524 [Bryopsis sp. KO-2023]